MSSFETECVSNSDGCRNGDETIADMGGSCGQIVVPTLLPTLPPTMSPTSAPTAAPTVAPAPTPRPTRVIGLEGGYYLGDEAADTDSQQLLVGIVAFVVLLGALVYLVRVWRKWKRISQHIRNDGRDEDGGVRSVKDVHKQMSGNDSNRRTSELQKATTGSSAVRSTAPMNGFNQQNINSDVFDQPEHDGVFVMSDGNGNDADDIPEPEDDSLFGVGNNAANRSTRSVGSVEGKLAHHRSPQVESDLCRLNNTTTIVVPLLLGFLPPQLLLLRYQLRQFQQTHHPSRFRRTGSLPRRRTDVSSSTIRSRWRVDGTGRGSDPTQRDIQGHPDNPHLKRNLW